MHLKIEKKIWDELNERYTGDEKVRPIKLLTLKREFEMDHKVVKGMLISLPIKVEAKVVVIEESCDLEKLTIFEMVSELQAHKQRFYMRMDDVTKGSFQARYRGKQPS
uniref:Retrovirus-related Pol polyprotein from transposon TNT 1-94 n=1 Tax=Cajanus cajan TaxID=3821 RepID=A0A151R517_CAJCA|nr:hypothetical protein KK1_041142 [Cajanus cajan]